MEKSEQYLIKSKDFESKVISSWQLLKNDKDLCDVTLACDDNQIQAHRLILSSSSPIFQNIFKYSKHDSTVYIIGLKFRDLKNILNFIYKGEVNIANEEIKSFLEAAKELKIKGLSLSIDIDSKSKFDLPQAVVIEIDKQNHKTEITEEDNIIDCSKSNVLDQHNVSDVEGFSQVCKTDSSLYMENVNYSMASA